MLYAQAIYQALRGAFEFDVEIGFRAYLRARPATKWVIAADFVLSGPERVNDTLAFTVHPYEQNDFSDLMEESRKAIPADIKRIKRVQPATVAFLADRSRFHFCFIPNMGRHDLGSWEDTQSALVDLLRHVSEWPDSRSKPDFLRKVEALVQRSKKRKFNYQLLHDIVLLAALSAWIAMLIAKHSRPEMILWACDRDAMTTAFDGIIHDMTVSNFHSLCQLEFVQGSKVALSQVVDHNAIGGRNAWFDDLIRAPDYIAGTLARWDLRTKEPRPVPAKVADVIDGAIGENPNLAIILIHCSLLGITTARVKAYSKDNTNLSAYQHRPESISDYLAWICLSRKALRQLTYRSIILGSIAVNPFGAERYLG